ncbi:MAG: hypothetical protein ACOH1R_05015 [Luteimonas sp.]
MANGIPVVPGARSRPAVTHWCIVQCVVATLALVTPGCATRSASVDHRMLLPEAGVQHVVTATQFFVMPMTLSAPEPVFPDVADPGATVEIVVCAEIWLSADGEISRIAPLDAAPGCASGAATGAQAYAESVVAALQRWEFSPAMICEFPPQAIDKRERGDCTGGEVIVRRVPVRLDYAFTFSSRNGRTRVGMARTPRQRDAPAGSAAR